MIRPLVPPFALWVHTRTALPARLPALADYALKWPAPLGRHPLWLDVLHRGLGHDVYAVEARAGDRVCGYLPLAFVSTPLFGRFLVSLPYLNSNGLLADAPDVEAALVARAVELADELDAKHLELRHETPTEHPALTGTLTSKVHMRLPLPDSADRLWKGYDAKVRNQVRKGEKGDLTVHWGGADLLDPFYAVLSHNMRDLGTPVYARRFFAAMLEAFPGAVELCVVRAGDKPVAAALLTHGPGVTEVPTASSLREFNPTNCNMLMYHHLLARAVERKQAVFDFGRSTADGPTFKFKKQWGAAPHPACWQYYLRGGSVGEVRPDNPKYERAIRVWQRLPVPVTRLLGPPIVRGIP